MPVDDIKTHGHRLSRHLVTSLPRERQQHCEELGAQFCEVYAVNLIAGYHWLAGNTQSHDEHSHQHLGHHYTTFIVIQMDRVIPHD